MGGTPVTLCRHFGSCGGCASQDVPYPDEIREKEERLRALFERDVAVSPSPREYHYRTRMDYVFAWHKLGLRKKGDSKGVFDLEECLLLSPRALEVFHAIRKSLVTHSIHSYSYTNYTGYLRYVTFREAPITGQIMVNFLTNGTDPAIRAVMEEVETESVVWSVSDRRADVSQGDVHEIRGQGWIEETIGSVRYRFGPNSFFQANPWVTEKLYAHVAERVEGRTTDLFCGVGGLALCAADRAKSMIGLDNNDESIRYADHNAKANGKNVRFYTGDARLFLIDHSCDTLIIDPPRSGIGPKSVRKTVRTKADRVIYVACNPKALATELPLFEGYELEDLRAFDLFPRTPHVEVVATLCRKER